MDTARWITFQVAESVKNHNAIDEKRNLRIWEIDLCAVAQRDAKLSLEVYVATFFESI